MEKKRRPAITPLERARWLEEIDQGKGITAIASAAKRDIRVVKRHVEVARRERELGQVRRDFIRQRLEQHQADLFRQGDRLRHIVGGRSARTLDPSESVEKKLYDAFRQHVGGHALGLLLETYQKEATRYRELVSTTVASLDAEQDTLLQPGMIGLVHRWTAGLLECLEGQAWRGSEWWDEYSLQPDDAGHGVKVAWGAYNVTRTPVSEDQATAIQQVHQKLGEHAQRLLNPLQEQAGRLQGLAFEIRDKLDVFTVSHFVPGRCDYCPA